MGHCWAGAVQCDDVLRWKADLDDKVRQPCGDPLPCLLLANKADLPVRPVPTAEIDDFVRTHGTVLARVPLTPRLHTKNTRGLGFFAWAEVSAKTNANVGEAVRALVEQVVAVYNADAADYAAPMAGGLRIAGHGGAGNSPAAKKPCCAD